MATVRLLAGHAPLPQKLGVLDIRGEERLAAKEIGLMDVANDVKRGSRSPRDLFDMVLRDPEYAMVASAHSGILEIRGRPSAPARRLWKAFRTQSIRDFIAEAHPDLPSFVSMDQIGVVERRMGRTTRTAEALSRLRRGIAKDRKINPADVDILLEVERDMLFASIARSAPATHASNGNGKAAVAHANGNGHANGKVVVPANGNGSPSEVHVNGNGSQSAETAPATK
ncbi:MAG: hypothetical protein KGH72_04445 [Candidatus Micrarchaeota archaeon]|nr:hypothetical protein [Candidatus Micrarchaeota archaeon]